MAIETGGATLSTSSEHDVLGRTEPRLWTPPLRDLGTAEAPNREATYGWDVIDFARDVLGQPLDPWQEWLVVHLGELLEDGVTPRFRHALVLVSRQNGKTFLLVVLTLYWQFVERQKLVLSTSTNLVYARESWLKAVDMAGASPWLSPEVGNVRRANGEEELTTASGCRYKIAASNRRGGRSLTINRLVMDELREHDSWEAWNAAEPAMNAVPDAQLVAISNQGDDSSIVLDSLRESALGFLETGDGDPHLGLFEWSAPPGSAPTDLEALAQANPNLGRRIRVAAILGAARRAERAGGEELAGFRTEVMCIRVHQADPAIDPDAWDAAGSRKPIDLARHRNKVALCLDLALDGSHASLVAAAVVDGQVHTEVVAAWAGYGCSAQLRRELPDIVARIKPRVIGWFPQGPAAAVAADLTERKGWPPRGVALEEIRGELTSTCMGLQDLVVAGEVVHPRDPMLSAHVNAAQKLRRGDAWVFTRKGAGAIDGAYALAGAVHLARTLPAAPPPLVAL